MNENDDVKDRWAVSVCCLMGLPGCGKSTFAKSLHDVPQKCTSMLSSAYGEIYIIEYDAIAKEELIIMRNGDVDDGKDGNLQSTFDRKELDAWRKGRVLALEMLKGSLITQLTGGGNEPGIPTLIVLDDNFHLRSMRRDIYQTCQEIINMHPEGKVGFSVIHFNTPLELCLRRNERRSGNDRVPQDVIIRMANIIEAPDESKSSASFERFHVSIDNADCDICDTTDTKGRHFIDEIRRCLEVSLESPIAPKSELSQEQIAQLEHQKILEKEETLKCEIQRIDQLLRKLVGAVGRVDKKRSREANEIRRSMLEMIREHGDMVDMSDAHIVRNFACTILDIDSHSEWRYLDNDLVDSMKVAYQDYENDSRNARLL